MFIIGLDKGFKIVLYAAVIIRILRAAVPVSPDGIFIAAADGVYFMDWDGNKKKIY